MIVHGPTCRKRGNLSIFRRGAVPQPGHQQRIRRSARLCPRRESAAQDLLSSYNQPMGSRASASAVGVQRLYSLHIPLNASLSPALSTNDNRLGAPFLPYRIRGVSRGELPDTHEGIPFNLSEGVNRRARILSTFLMVSSLGNRPALSRAVPSISRRCRNYAGFETVSLCSDSNSPQSSSLLSGAGASGTY